MLESVPFQASHLPQYYDQHGLLLHAPGPYFFRAGALGDGKELPIMECMKGEIRGQVELWKGTPSFPFEGAWTSDSYLHFLEHLARFAPARKSTGLDGYRHKDVFLRPPGITVEEGVTVGYEGGRCIMLDANALETDPDILSDGGVYTVVLDKTLGYYDVKVSSAAASERNTRNYSFLPSPLP